MQNILSWILQDNTDLDTVKHTILNTAVQYWAKFYNIIPSWILHYNTPSWILQYTTYLRYCIVLELRLRQQLVQKRAEITRGRISTRPAWQVRPARALTSIDRTRYSQSAPYVTGTREAAFGIFLRQAEEICLPEKTQELRRTYEDEWMIGVLGHDSAL